MWWWTEKVTILYYFQAFYYHVMEIVINTVFVIRIVNGYLHQIASDVRFNYFIFDNANGRAFRYFVTKYDNYLTIMTFKFSCSWIPNAWIWVCKYSSPLSNACVTEWQELTGYNRIPCKLLKIGAFSCVVLCELIEMSICECVYPII